MHWDDFFRKNHPNLKARVVRPNPDLCGIYRVFVPPYTFDRVEARRDARSERDLRLGRLHSEFAWLHLRPLNPKP